MDSTQLSEVTKNLEELTVKGQVLAGGLMRPFKDSECENKLECPWLHRAIEEGIDISKVRGLLLMQDWGSELEVLQGAVDYIKNALKNPGGVGKDRTLKNLFAKEGWKEAIEKGEWLVSNAVWGLRPQKDGNDSEMCGYLGAPIHKASFPIWGQLVVELSCKKDDFQLVVAGEWATFDGFPGESNSEPLSAYLGRWVNWASRRTGKVEVPPKLKEDCQNAKGTVLYVRHPCTWHMNDYLEKGPPG